jgi:uncharacterized Zn finger protein
MKDTYDCKECDYEGEINVAKVVLLGREGAGITVVCDKCGHYNKVE